MTSINLDAILKLEQNKSSNACYVDSVSTLLKVLDMIIREPYNEKYRSIRLENKVVKEKLLCLNGIREVLDHIGFLEVS